jgi:DNA polymerase elongation subunit (family B)
VDGIAGEMQDYLNEFYDILADRYFNVKDHRLEIKKEYVAKAGIWIAKKRYAQWIISNNGVPVDELDVKGLDVVRSSFPKAFQELMSTVIIDILRGKTRDEISDIVLDFKKQMTSKDVGDIGRNSAVKELSKYQLKETSSLFEFKKSTPAHVKAAISYNTLMKHFDVPFKYEPMKNGDKVKWVYLKDNPLGLDALAFHGYNDPPQIMDFVNQYIDHDKIFERELLKKLQDFYNALDWGEVINEKKNAEKFFSF